MKVAILVIVAFFMLGTLGAEELNLFNIHERIHVSKYEFGVSNFNFGKKEHSMPGITLFVNSESLRNSDFKVMFAKALSKVNNTLLRDINPEKSVLYAELTYRF